MLYKDLEIWKIANDLENDIHYMTLNDLPVFEKFETGSQIRRSIKSVKANVAEGFGRKRYKKDFIHFLTIAKGSADETMNHLESLFMTNSLKDKKKYDKLHENLDKLCRKLFRFIESVERNHNDKH